MRVALDVTATTTGVTGVARYARELTSALIEADIDVLPYAIGRGPHAAPEGTRRVTVPLRVVQRGWSLAGIPRAEHLVRRPDLIHNLDLLPTPSRRPRVMTAHDLVAVQHPGLHSVSQVETQTLQLAAYRRVDHVVADSQATADALVSHGVESDRISVALLGRTALPLTPESCNPIDGPYLLVVGELAARKNLPTLIRAFRNAALPADLSLVLVGPLGYRSEETQALLGGRVISLGCVDDAALGGLYRGATVLCFPSIAEGFGLPLLEAMHVGLPILASELPVMREVAGAAARYVNPLSVQDWCRALEDLVSDPSAQGQLGNAGRQRSEGLTWSATAAATIAAYGKVLLCASL